MIRFKGLLTPEAQSLVEDASEIVNIFASRLCEDLEVSDFSDFPPAPVFTRVMLIRAMSVGALANWLQRELGDGVPVDWYEWLTEEAQP